MLKFFRKIIESIENTQTSFVFWLFSFLGLIISRLLIEGWLGNFQNKSGLFIFYEFTNTFFFFLLAYILILLTLKKFLNLSFQKISNILLWGYFIILTPPLIDYVISGGQGFWSFFKFDGLLGLSKRFITFFGDKPEIGITYGVRAEVALAVALIFAYSFLKSKNILKSLYLSLISYSIFFILGTFPSWITIATAGFSKGFLKITDIDIAKMFLAPAKIFSREIPDIVSTLNIKMSLVFALFLTGIICLGLFFNFKEKFISFIKNFRLPQIFYHWGLLCAGFGMGLIFTDAFLEINLFNILSFIVLLIAVTLAWLASVVINDIIDQKVDRITNASRPLIQNNISLSSYKILGCILFSASILFSAIVNTKIALLLIIYQAIAWLYSCWPLRLKRFAFISTFASAIASLMILFSGFILISPDQTIKSLPFQIILLLVIGYTLALPIKDFKDIPGDRKEGIYTVPVLFGENWGKIIVGSGIFISFILSVVIFNEFRLFWWALICGAISFWIILSSGEQKRIAYRRLPWWIMGTVAVYGLILIKIVFL